MNIAAGLAGEIAVCEPEPSPGWQTTPLVRCACAHCGTHAYRRLGPDGARALAPTGGPAICTVCGGEELMALSSVS